MDNGQFEKELSLLLQRYPDVSDVTFSTRTVHTLGRPPEKPIETLRPIPATIVTDLPPAPSFEQIKKIAGASLE